MFIIRTLFIGFGVALISAGAHANLEENYGVAIAGVLPCPGIGILDKPGNSLIPIEFDGRII